MEVISTIFKCRGESIVLIDTTYTHGVYLCDKSEQETIIHFLGKCKRLEAIRIKYFSKPIFCFIYF